MRCKNCDYPLWTLKTRACPECGRPFAPSEYEFVANSVRYCCPHCEQAYYGTDAAGHLVPRQFECVSCKTFIRMDDMVLRPAEGVVESQTRAGSNPWLNRREHGRWRAFFNTIGMSMVSPGRLMQVTPADGGHLDAWWLATIIQTLIIVIALLPMVLLVGGVGVAAGGGMGGVGTMVGVFVLYMVIGAIGTMLNILVWGAVTHVILHFTGGATFGIGRTYQAICYSSAANGLTAVPCFGAYVGWIWWVVSAVLMVKEAQQVSGGRASFAVLFMPVATLITCIGGYAAIVVWSMSNMGPGGAWATAVSTTMAQTETQKVTAALVDYADDNAGAAPPRTGPPHAAHLLVADHLNAWQFIASDSATANTDAPLADADLQAFVVARKPAVIKAADAAAAALPPNVIAHRLGDYVFTYHGVDFTTTDPLWIVILCFDPDVPGNAAVGPVYYAGHVDGSVTPIPAASLPVELSAQNNLRALHNLPPLPDPTTITHANPATAP